ncbi:hypothetical protein E2C01_084124 [Portunus trituberculatus]|uniref:Uncharacterized protein n=1 Tax=Portunus trituberculatus TaxID=210409 RepID=A0A5B7J3G1_PORTR|nr:hypothetical protein [Portunus trituberculatus]
MPGGQLIIPSHGLGVVVEFGHSHAFSMFDGLLPTQNMNVGVSHKASMLGNQSHVPCVEVGMYSLAPIPGSHPLPLSGLDHVDPARSCEDDEQDVPASQDVSPVLYLIGQVRAYLHLPSPEAPSLSQLTGVERAQGSVLPRQLSLTLPWSVMAQAVHEEAQCRSLKKPKPCSANFQLSRDWYGEAKSFYLPEGASLAPPLVNEELGGLQAVGNPAVSVSSHLLAQWRMAGAACSTKQDVLEFLSPLAKAKKNVLRPASELPKPHRIHLQEGAQPYACHTPASIPKHWASEV